jgi:holo-[acyl-carrier protein] synthase
VIAPQPLVVGIGVDLAPVAGVQRMLERYSDAELGLVFTAGELRRARAARLPARHLAVCFGAKEAAGKALGCGMAAIAWTDVEAVVETARIEVVLRGRALRRARALGARGSTASWAPFDAELVLVTVTVHR